MVEEIKKNCVYKAEKSYDGLIKGRKYLLIGETRLTDPRGWAYDDFTLIFVDTETKEKVKPTNVSGKMLTEVKDKELSNVK